MEQMQPQQDSPFSRSPKPFRQETLPAWLQAAGENPQHAEFNLVDLLTDSLYYPACGLNGTPIKHFSGFIHSFVYADYWIDKAQYLSDIRAPDGVTGYKAVLERDLVTADIVPTGWTPKLLPSREKWESLQRRQSHAKPFGQWTIWKRQPQFGSEHGPLYFSLLYFCGEMSALYQGLYMRLNIAPKVIALIQPGAMGGEWERPVSADSFFKQVVDANPAGLPRYLLRGSYHHGGINTSEWLEFQQEVYRIHERAATLWERTD